MKWTVILTKETDPDPAFAQTYHAECVELPGCVTFGDGIEQTLAHMQEAITGHLQVMLKYSEPLPTGTTIVDVSALEEPPAYIISLEVPVPQKVAA